MEELRLAGGAGFEPSRRLGFLKQRFYFFPHAASGDITRTNPFFYQV